MIKKNKLIFLVAAFSLVGSAAVCADDSGLIPYGKNADNKAQTAVTKEAPTKTKKKCKKHVKHVHAKHSSSLETQVKDLRKEVAELKQQQEEGKSGASWSRAYAYGPAIVTTPIIGEPDYTGYDLYINMPSINEDLALLQFNQRLNNYLKQNHVASHDRPIVAFSGEVEGQILNASAFNRSSRNDINLSTVALEAVANISTWVTGMVKFEYSDSPPEIGARVTNSQVQVKRAYITVGNLDKFPVYGTLGQIYVPFGVYNTWMTTEPMTRTLGKLQERALVVGFNKCGAYGSVFAFEGDSYVNSTNVIDSWGANLGYKFTQPRWNLDVGASYIANIVDSLGMQDNGFAADPASNKTFTGFKFHEKLEKQVPAADVHALFMYDPVWFAAEYVSTIEDFDARDLTFNGQGAHPQALDVEGIYNFHFVGKPAFVSAGYGQSWEALALNIPENSYYVSTGISIFKNTIQTLEYRYDTNYDENDVSTSPRQNEIFVPGQRHRNIVTFCFRVFF